MFSNTEKKISVFKNIRTRVDGALFLNLMLSYIYRMFITFKNLLRQLCVFMHEKLLQYFLKPLSKSIVYVNCILVREYIRKFPIPYHRVIDRQMRTSQKS